MTLGVPGGGFEGGAKRALPTPKIGFAISNVSDTKLERGILLVNFMIFATKICLTHPPTPKMLMLVPLLGVPRETRQ